MVCMKKSYKWLSLVLALVMVVLPINNLQANEIYVEITKEDPVIILSNEGERIFDIGYEFSVDYEATVTGLDLVIVLDRSNSMLRLDPSTELPVADAVWKAVNKFVTGFYTTYPDSNVAVVSFGSNANKSDNWKYYNTLEDTLEEIVEVYDYRDLYSDYHSNFRAYWNNGYRYAWENWQITDGATNIHAAFDYGARTIEMKQTINEPNGQDVIIFFTDGVATQGGSNSQKNYNYPTSHNTNTIAAYTAGREAQEVAEIITVGYFEGIEYESTKNVARETLQWSQNAGLFEASQTGQLSSIFDTIVEELNYIGTDAVITETIEDEFEVVFGSIQPENYTMTYDAEGRTVIKWPLGNVIDANYEFGYQVRVKDDVYPTGSGTIKIPINLDATLTYTNLEGVLVTELLGHNEVSIPPRGNQPLVNVDAKYDGNVFGYLVGDPIHIQHDLSFENEAPFDYRKIQVDALTKIIKGNNFNTRLVLDQSSKDNGWTLVGGNVVYDIDDEKAVTGDDNLIWDHQVDLTLIPKQVGTYALSSNVDYTLTNSVNTEFTFANAKPDPQALSIREGVLTINFVDDAGLVVYNIPVKVDGSYMNPYVYNGIHEYKSIVSGAHEVTFNLPSGYKLMESNVGLTMDEDNVVSFSFDLDYDAPKFNQVVKFEALDIKNISVTDRDGKDYAHLMTLNQKTKVLVTFTLVEALDKIILNLVDDYTLNNHKFTLDMKNGSTWVTKADGTKVNGFTVVNNQLKYEGTALAKGTYVAYGIIDPPQGFGDDLDYTFYVDVNELTTRRPGLAAETNPVSSKGLTLGIIDEDAPLVVSTFDDKKSTSNLGKFMLEITDLINIAEVLIYEGDLSIDEIDEDAVVIDYKEVKNQVNTLNHRYLEVNIPLNVVQIDDKFESVGFATVYVRDEIGNEAVYLLEVDSRSDYSNIQ